jgi:hypothetical protein
MVGLHNHPPLKMGITNTTFYNCTSVRYSLTASQNEGKWWKAKTYLFVFPGLCCSGGLVFPKREYDIRRGPHDSFAVVSLAPYLLPPPPNPQSNHSIFRASSLVFSLCRKLPNLKLIGRGRVDLMRRHQEGAWASSNTNFPPQLFFFIKFMCLLSITALGLFQLPPLPFAPI